MKTIIIYWDYKDKMGHKGDIFGSPKERQDQYSKRISKKQNERRAEERKKQIETYELQMKHGFILRWPIVY